MSNIDTFNCDLINWLKGIPYLHSQSYRQPGRNGNGHALGVVYGDPTTLRTTTFVLDKAAGEAHMTAAAALCGQPHIVAESAMYAPETLTGDVFFESVRVVAANAAVGPGNLRYKVILDFTVYIPV